MTDREMKDAIQSEIKALMDSVLQNALVNKPFDVEHLRKTRPLYLALVPQEIFKGSHFERKFVTPFGKSWQKLAKVAAEKSMGYCQTEYMIEGMVDSERLRRIQTVLDKLEHGLKLGKRIKPNWDQELDYILAGKSVNETPCRVNCDIYAIDQKNNKRYSYELKTPLPNSDITKVSKEKLFKLYSMKPRLIDEAYFALPYNPFGKKEDYHWSPPMRWFDMIHDKSVLIGEEFWEGIGGIGTYDTLINAVNEIGEVYKNLIYHEYLGIEPPEDSKAIRL